jgi:hypothetical protein
MPFESDIFVVGCLALLITLIWRKIRFEKRLSEIEGHLCDIEVGIRDLQLSYSKLTGLMAKPNEKESSAKVTPTGSAQLAAAARRSRADAKSMPRVLSDAEAEITRIDGLCAKLITLVPPREAAPLLSDVAPGHKTLPEPRVLNAERLTEPTVQGPTTGKGRRLILPWPMGD